MGPEDVSTRSPAPRVLPGLGFGAARTFGVRRAITAEKLDIFILKTSWKAVVID
jgi:hypothetical protein